MTVARFGTVCLGALLFGGVVAMIAAAIVRSRDEPAACSGALDDVPAAAACEQACGGGDAVACGRAALFWGAGTVAERGDEPPKSRPARDPARAHHLWRRACAFGDAAACRAAGEEGQRP